MLKISPPNISTVSFASNQYHLTQDSLFSKKENLDKSIEKIKKIFNVCIEEEDILHLYLKDTYKKKRVTP